ncbi:hypothetical protein MMPV_008253 [Pyropia vietnamensis]
MWYLLHPTAPGSVTPPLRTYLGGPTAAPITIGRKAATIRPDGHSVSRRHATVTVTPAVSGSANDGGRGNDGGRRFPARPTAVFVHDTSAHGTWVTSAAAVAAAAAESTNPVAAACKAPAGTAARLAEGDTLSFGTASAGAYTLCWDPLEVAMGVEDALLSATIRAHAAAAGFATLPTSASFGGAAATAASLSVEALLPPARRIDAFPATTVWGAPGRPVTRLLRAVAMGATPVTPAWTGALVDAVKSAAGVLPAPRPYSPAVIGLPGVAGGSGGAPAGDRSALDSSKSEAVGRGIGGGGGGGGEGVGGGGDGNGVGGDGDGFPRPLAGLLTNVRVQFAHGDTGADWAPVVAAAGATVIVVSGGGIGSGSGRLLHVTGPPEGVAAGAAAAEPPRTVSWEEGVGRRVGVADLAAALLRGDTAPLFGVSLAASAEGGESPSPTATVGRLAKRARVGGEGGGAGTPAAAAPPRVVVNARVRAMAMLGFDSSSDEEEGDGGEGGGSRGTTPAVPTAAPRASDGAAAAAAATTAVIPGTARGHAAMDPDADAGRGGGIGSPGLDGGTVRDGGGEATAMDMSPPVLLGDGSDEGNEAAADGGADADARADSDDQGGGSGRSSADASLPPDSPVAPGFVPAPAATRRRFHGRHRRGDGTTAADGDDDGGVNPVVVAPLLTACGVPEARPRRLLPSHSQGPLRRGQPSGSGHGGMVDVRVFSVRQLAAPRVIPLVAIRDSSSDGGACDGGI